MTGIVRPFSLQTDTGNSTSPGQLFRYTGNYGTAFITSTHNGSQMSAIPGCGLVCELVNDPDRLCSCLYGYSSYVIDCMDFLYTFMNILRTLMIVFCV